MKRLLLLLISLIPVLTSAQDFRHRYFHYNQKYDAPRPFTITSITNDAADTNEICIAGGGACSFTRGGYIYLGGEQSGGLGGAVRISASDAGTDNSITFFTHGQQRFAVADTADADDVSLLLGHTSTTAPSFTIRGQTADGDDDGRLCITGGGACGGAGRGAYIQLDGQDLGNGQLYINSGGSSSSNIYFATGSGADVTTKWTMAPSAATVSDLIFGASGTASSVATIRGARADGSDDGELRLASGGSAMTTRGAYIDLFGNEHSGNGAMILYAGEDAANGGISLATGAGVTRLTTPYLADADDADLIFGTSSTTAPIFTIRGQTADGDDDGILALTGAGSASVARGAFISLYGDDVAGAGASGQVLIHAGNASNSTIQFYTGNDLQRWQISGGDLIQNATNGGNIVFNRDLYGVIDSTDAPAAAGAGLADATALTAVVTFVTGADGAKGVKFPAAPIAGQRYVIYNTANAILKVYPGEAGDQINAAGAGVAVSVAEYASVYCHASSAAQLWCGERANP